MYQAVEPTIVGHGESIAKKIQNVGEDSVGIRRDQTKINTVQMPAGPNIHNIGGRGTGSIGTVYPINPAVDDRGTVADASIDIVIPDPRHHYTKITLNNTDPIINIIDLIVGLSSTFTLDFTNQIALSSITFVPALIAAPTFDLGIGARNTLHIVGHRTTSETRYEVISGGSGGGSNVPSGTVENEHLEWDNATLTWNAVQAMTFGDTGPFATTGFLRTANDQILAASRNLANDGDMQLKFNGAGLIDFTESANNAVGFQLRAQNATNPDATFSIIQGSDTGGSGGSAFIDVLNGSSLSVSVDGTGYWVYDDATTTNKALLPIEMNTKEIFFDADADSGIFSTVDDTIQIFTNNIIRAAFQDTLITFGVDLTMQTSNIIAGGAGEGMSNIGELVFVNNTLSPAGNGIFFFDGTDLKAKTGSTTVNLTNIGGSNFTDAVFRVVDEVDATKKFAVDVGTSSTGVTTTLLFGSTVNRTISFPNATTTLAGLNTVHTWLGANTFAVDIIAGGAGFGMITIGHLDFVDNLATPAAALSIYSDGTDLFANTGGGVVNFSDIGTGEFFGPWTANHDAGNFNLIGLNAIAFTDAGGQIAGQASAPHMNFVLTGDSTFRFTTNAENILDITDAGLTILGTNNIALGNNNITGVNQIAFNEVNQTITDSSTGLDFSVPDAADNFDFTINSTLMLRMEKFFADWSQTAQQYTTRADPSSPSAGDVFLYAKTGLGGFASVHQIQSDGTITDLAAGGGGEFFGPWTANHAAGNFDLTGLNAIAFTDAGGQINGSVSAPHMNFVLTGDSTFRFTTNAENILDITSSGLTMLGTNNIELGNNNVTGVNQIAFNEANQTITDSSTGLDFSVPDATDNFDFTINSTLMLRMEAFFADWSQTAQQYTTRTDPASPLAGDVFLYTKTGLGGFASVFQKQSDGTITDLGVGDGATKELDNLTTTAINAKLVWGATTDIPTAGEVGLGRTGDILVFNTPSTGSTQFRNNGAAKMSISSTSISMTGNLVTFLDTTLGNDLGDDINFFGSMNTSILWNSTSDPPVGDEMGVGRTGDTLQWNVPSSTGSFQLRVGSANKIVINPTLISMRANINVNEFAIQFDGRAVPSTVTGEPQLFADSTNSDHLSIKSGDGSTIDLEVGGGGSQTPITQDIDYDGFDIKDLSNIEFRDTTGAPASTLNRIWSTSSGLHLGSADANEEISFALGGSIQIQFEPDGEILFFQDSHTIIPQSTSLDFTANNASNEFRFQLGSSSSNPNFVIEEERITLRTEDADTQAAVFQMIQNNISPMDFRTIANIDMLAENSSSIDTIYVRISGSSQDITVNTEDGLLQLGVVSDGTLVSGIDIEGGTSDANGAKIGFFGVTPVAQQTVGSDSLGNLYTAVRNLGLLAPP